MQLHTLVHFTTVLIVLFNILSLNLEVIKIIYYRVL